MRRFFVFWIMIFAMYCGLTAPASAAKKKPILQKQQEQTERFKRAEAALYASDLKRALPELALLCEQNNLKACALLGYAYYNGRYGLSQNTQNALIWYEKCAQHEKDYACRNELGLIYFNAKAYKQAFDYFLTGAKAGNARAQYLTGKMYLDEKVVPADSEAAVMWLRRAAHNSQNPEKQAQCLMTELSYYGIGMRPSIKDTDYWLKKCDNPLIRALKALYGNGVPKNQDEARRIMKSAGLKEALADWDDFTLKSKPSVGKKTVRDSVIPQDCAVNDFIFGAGRSNPKIETYAVKIFGEDYYRTFTARDGFSETGAFAIDQTFEACGITFFTTRENKMLFNKALRNRAIVKISRYKNACLGFETVGVCDLNLPWEDVK